MKEQEIISSNYEKELENILSKYSDKGIFIVHGKSYEGLTWNEWFETRYKVVHFTDFQVNPIYESTVLGRNRFIESGCEIIVAVGGGSAIDVAKCIKLFAGMNECDNYINADIGDCSIPLVAIPTTAGTGSESTRFAVIYYGGEKYSVMDDSIIPEVAVLDTRTIESLPLFQKKVTMCDALAHAIEAYWSVNATEKSREYSQKAIGEIVNNYKAFMDEDELSNESMLIASNMAGKAINIAFTTAGHAMSYKITSMFSLPHGQAVIICLPAIWRHMLKRENEKLNKVFCEIAKCLGKDSIVEGIEFLENFIKELDLVPKISLTKEQLVELADSVNVGRLKNNPIIFEKEELYEIYSEVFS